MSWSLIAHRTRKGEKLVLPCASLPESASVTEKLRLLPFTFKFAELFYPDTVEKSHEPAVN